MKKKQPHQAVEHLSTKRLNQYLKHFPLTFLSWNLHLMKSCGV